MIENNRNFQISNILITHIGELKTLTILMIIILFNKGKGKMVITFIKLPKILFLYFCIILRTWSDSKSNIFQEHEQEHGKYNITG